VFLSTSLFKKLGAIDPLPVFVEGDPPWLYSPSDYLLLYILLSLFVFAMVFSSLKENCLLSIAESSYISDLFSLIVFFP
jgi:hypothetical protein